MRRPKRSTVLLGLVVLLLATVPVLIPLLVTKAGSAPARPEPQALAAPATPLPVPLEDGTTAPRTTAAPPPRARGLAPTPSPTATTPSPEPTTPSPTPAPTTTAAGPTSRAPEPTASPTPTPTEDPTVLEAEPDLVVLSVGWIPGDLLAGTQVTFTATVRNTGTEATPDRTHGIAFAVDGTKVTWSAGSSQPLAPGETRTYTADGGDNGSTWPATQGAHTLTATADDLNRIPESNETNNTATTPLPVP